VAEVGESPSHLRDLVPARAEGQDGVTIGLSDRIAVTEAVPADVIGLQDRPVDGRRGLLEPRHQRGPNVEGAGREGVDDGDDPALAVDAPRGGVRRVTLRRDALVPVVVGRGGVLDLDAPQPGILPGRLVEVTVDRDEAGGAHGRWDRSRSAGARPTVRWTA